MASTAATNTTATDSGISKLEHYLHLIVAPNGADRDTVPTRPKSKIGSPPALQPHDYAHQKQNPQPNYNNNDVELGKLSPIYSSKVEHHTTEYDYGSFQKRHINEEKSIYDNTNAKTHKELTELYEVDYPQAYAAFGRRLFAEFIGTAILTLTHGLARLQAEIGLITFEAHAYAVGLSLVFLIYAIGSTSGAHLNPAVTLAFALRRVFPVIWIPFYWSAQIVGAILGGALIRAIFNIPSEAENGTSGVGPGFAISTGFAAEIIFATILIFVILRVTNRRGLVGQIAALAVGSTIATCVLVIGRISSGSLNPARSLGAWIVNGPHVASHIWPFVAGPFIGCLLGVAFIFIIDGLQFDKSQLTAAQGETEKRK